MTALMLITAVSFWGLSFVATKVCLDYGMTPAEVIAARFAFGVPVLIIAAAVRKLDFTFIRKRWATVLACALVLTLHLLIQVEGLKTTTANNAAWLITTIPVFIVALSFIFLKEKITFRQATGIAVAAFGVLILISRGKLGSLQFIKSYGDWLVLTSCFTWSIYTILGKKLSEFSTLAVTTTVLTMVGILIIPPVIIKSGMTMYWHLPSKVIISLVFLGVFSLGFAYLFWTIGLKRKSAGQVGVYLYFEPISTMIAAPIILGEEITSSLILGGILVVSGVYMVQMKRLIPRRAGQV